MWFTVAFGNHGIMELYSGIGWGGGLLPDSAKPLSDPIKKWSIGLLNQLCPDLRQCQLVNWKLRILFQESNGLILGSGFRDLLPECCNSRNRSVSTKMILPKDYLNNCKIQRKCVGLCLYTHMQQSFVPTLIWLIAGWWYLQCVNNRCAVILQWAISAGIEK